MKFDKNKIKPLGEIRTENYKLEEIKTLKYLGLQNNNTNVRENVIKEMLIAGNNSFYENEKLLTNKRLNKKIKIYKTIVRLS